MKRVRIDQLATGIALTVCIVSACTSDSGHDLPERTPVDAAAGDFGSLNPLAPAETEHWGQLAGVWDCLVSTPGDDGSVEQSRATWTWRYILDGHAIQDVYAGRDGSTFRGTGVRIYHPHLASWEISWIANSAPAEGVPRITQFTATSTDDEIVMRRTSGDPNWRTVFHDIRRDTFAWMSEPSGQEMVCERRAAGEDTTTR